MWETRVRSLGWEDPLEKEMTIHSGTLAWKIPWTEEPGSHSPWGCKELDMTEQELDFTSHLLTWDFIFQCHIFLPFHTVYGVLKARILTWFAIPFSSGSHFVRTLHHAPSWVALHGMAHSFTELDKAVVCVIRMVSFL